jgi:hypothetical protein
MQLATEPLVPAATAAARADFERARWRERAARACRRLMAHRPTATRPRDLGGVAALSPGPARLRPIPIEAIVGTVDATADFDAGFRPATERVSARWQSVARAHRSGRALPPIAVIERRDGYYVLDGRHRVSVARALGREDIDAWTSPATPVPLDRRGPGRADEKARWAA